MDLYLGGTEQRLWRKLLESYDVTHVSLSYMGLRRRRKNPLDFVIADEYAPGTRIFLDSGAATLNKSDDVDEFDARTLREAYHQFVLANVERIEFASEFDAQVLGLSEIDEIRDTFWRNLPGSKWMPIWHASYGIPDLVAMAEQFDRLGVLQSEAKGTDLAPRLRYAASQTKLHGVSMTSMDSMRETAWSSVGTTSWLNVTMHGETFVWTGRELKWYPKREKDRARKRHRSWLVDNGFDADLIESDDNGELLKLSVWSWKNFAASLNQGRAVTIDVLNPFPENTEPATGVVDIPATPGRNVELPSSRQRRVLPVLGITYEKGTDAEGNEIEVPHLSTPDKGMLRCDNCFMRDKCPEFEPGQDCVFEIPAKVRTMSQLTAVQDWLIETQTQRVAFMRLIEQAEGGYSDSNTSSEIDRLSKLIKAKTDAGKDGISINIANVASPGGPSMISRIFGSETAAKMGELPAAVDPENIIDATIVE